VACRVALKIVGSDGLGTSSGLEKSGRGAASQIEKDGLGLNRHVH
jgi:hypothetical protein